MLPRNRITRVLVGLAVIGAASMAGATIANASNPPVHYTGCLSSQGGISKVAIGDSPTSNCPNNTTKIQLGDGSAAAASGLPTGCSMGQVAKQYASWSCAPDIGAYQSKTGPLSITAAPAGSNCPDGSVFSSFATKTANNKANAFSLPTGTYRPGAWGDFHYSIDKVTNPYGDSWAGGYVKVEIVRIRGGVETTASSWVRTKSQNLENALPYEREFVPFSTLGNDQYYMRLTVSADECVVANLLNVEVSFDRIN